MMHDVYIVVSYKQLSLLYSTLVIYLISNKFFVYSQLILKLVKPRAFDSYV